MKHSAGMTRKKILKVLASNKRISFIAWLAIFLVAQILATPIQAEEQNKNPKEEPRFQVFLDCENCYLDYLQKEIDFVRFTSIRQQAQVYIQIIARSSEGGGLDYIISFTGQKQFKGDNDQLEYKAQGKEEGEIKRGLAEILKMGLMRYIGKTPLSKRIKIDFLDKVKPTAVEDKWNFWVFSLSANAFLNGEKLFKSGMYFGSFSANRVTPEWKIRLSLGGSYNRSDFTVDDETIISSSSSRRLSGLIVKSINDHWSVGAYFSALSSTYSNVNFSLNPAPAVEFDLFPYSQSTKRQLRFLYRLGFQTVRYLEETIYAKTSENLWKETLSVTLELKQPWGNASASLEGSHYLHDFNKNRLVFYGQLSLRLFKGFNYNIDFRYSRIRDQLSLARGGASLEEVLLRRKELATTYNYSLSMGLSFTFGSVHSNVVNPRFGDGGRGISIRF